MRMEKVSALRGPNVWSRAPVLEVWVTLEDGESPDTSAVGLGRLATVLMRRAGSDV